MRLARLARGSRRRSKSCASCRGDDLAVPVPGAAGVRAVRATRRRVRRRARSRGARAPIAAGTARGLRGFLDIRFHRWNERRPRRRRRRWSATAMLQRLLARAFPEADQQALHNTLLQGAARPGQRPARHRAAGHCRGMVQRRSRPLSQLFARPEPDDGPRRGRAATTSSPTFRARFERVPGAAGASGARAS